MSKDRQNQRREQQAGMKEPARDVTQAGPAPTVSDEVRPCVRPGVKTLRGARA